MTLRSLDRLTIYAKGCTSVILVSGSPVPTLSFQTPQPITPTQPSSLPTISHAVETSAPAAPSSNETPSFTPTLSTPAILGISISLTLSVILILFLMFGMPYLRQWKRERALKRAVDEVERGIEMRKNVGHGSASGATESKENMVLESRVEIVVGDEESVRDVVETWDGWNATWTGDDDEGEGDRGRKGMSLPRREY